LPSRGMPMVTNIWSKVIESGWHKTFSRIVVESTGLLDYSIARDGCNVILEAAGAAANMPEGLIEVNDGLVGSVLLEQSGPDRLTVRILAEHPAECLVEVTEGIPVRTSVILDRSFLVSLLEGRRIVIDPGHGGNDAGGKGPVNLLEKNVVMPIAANLKRLFEQADAEVLLTRNADVYVPPSGRAEVAEREKADLFISIHTYSSKSSKVGGAAVLYGPHPGSADLAGHIKEELVKKLKLRDRGTGMGRECAALKNMPSVTVEVVTITNWVEEGLLRSPTFHRKAAEGIFNGVKNYFARQANI